MTTTTDTINRGDNMIISRNYAQRLIRDGRATVEGSIIDNGTRCVTITRHDIQRTDHYEEA